MAKMKLKTLSGAKKRFKMTACLLYTSVPLATACLTIANWRARISAAWP